MTSSGLLEVLKLGYCVQSKQVMGLLQVLCSKATQAVSKAGNRTVVSYLIIHYHCCLHLAQNSAISRSWVGTVPFFTQNRVVPVFRLARSTGLAISYLDRIQGLFSSVLNLLFMCWGFREQWLYLSAPFYSWRVPLPCCNLQAPRAILALRSQVLVVILSTPSFFSKNSSKQRLA